MKEHLLRFVIVCDGTPALGRSNDQVSGNSINSFANGTTAPRTNQTQTAGNHAHAVTIDGGADTETAPDHVYLAYMIKTTPLQAKSQFAAGQGVTVDTQPPVTNIIEGDMYLNRNTGQLYVAVDTRQAGAPQPQWAWIEITN